MSEAIIVRKRRGKRLPPESMMRMSENLSPIPVMLMTPVISPAEAQQIATIRHPFAPFSKAVIIFLNVIRVAGLI
jgi:hypothetical protein